MATARISPGSGPVITATGGPGRGKVPVSVLGLKLFLNQNVVFLKPFQLQRPDPAAWQQGGEGWVL